MLSTLQFPQLLLSEGIQEQDNISPSSPPQGSFHGPQAESKDALKPGTHLSVPKTFQGHHTALAGCQDTVCSACRQSAPPRLTKRYLHRPVLLPTLHGMRCVSSGTPLEPQHASLPLCQHPHLQTNPLPPPRPGFPSLEPLFLFIFASQCPAVSSVSAIRSKPLAASLPFSAPGELTPTLRLLLGTHYFVICPPLLPLPSIFLVLVIYRRVYHLFLIPQPNTQTFLFLQFPPSPHPADWTVSLPYRPRIVRTVNDHFVYIYEHDARTAYKNSISYAWRKGLRSVSLTTDARH